MRHYVFYRLVGERYRLKFDNRTAFIGKTVWNTFIARQHNRKPGDGVSLMGSVGVDAEELAEIEKKFTSDFKWINAEN